jgi:glyoxylase-like metal-dependent hydrolase (beta-lactamase superfamily II)
MNDDDVTLMVILICVLVPIALLAFICVLLTTFIVVCHIITVVNTGCIIIDTGCATYSSYIGHIICTKCRKSKSDTKSVVDKINDKPTVDQK